jgi:hypothetical protein
LVRRSLLEMLAGEGQVLYDVGEDRSVGGKATAMETHAKRVLLLWKLI